jgi:hypothetical protein
MTDTNTFRQWLKDNLDAGQLRDLANHGADAGWPGLIYTSDTVKLFDQFGDEIWELAVEQAEQLGEGNVATMIGGFRRADMLDSLDTFKNLMVWFAAEEYARQLTDGEAEDADDEEARDATD